VGWIIDPSSVNGARAAVWLQRVINKKTRQAAGFFDLMLLLLLLIGLCGGSLGDGFLFLNGFLLGSFFRGQGFEHFSALLDGRFAGFVGAGFAAFFGGCFCGSAVGFVFFWRGARRRWYVIIAADWGNHRILLLTIDFASLLSLIYYRQAAQEL